MYDRRPKLTCYEYIYIYIYIRFLINGSNDIEIFMTEKRLKKRVQGDINSFISI